MDHTGTEDYYQRRASEYDRIYDIPERQPELRRLERLVAATLRGRRVLEVAAGTGYWTQFFADTAQTVVATDINESVLDVARGRRVWPDSVTFRPANVYELTAVDGEFDAAFAGFLWSHIVHADLDRLLSLLARRLEPGSVMLFLDNLYVPDSDRPVVRTDDDGNSYQERRLDDGSTWEVLKNFPTADEIRARLERVGDNTTVTEFEYFWAAEVRTTTAVG